MMALGDMATLYPDLTPTIQYGEENPETSEDTTTDPKWGDANCDGSVNIMDIILLNKAIYGKADLSAQGLKNADVDQDGKPTATDSLNIMKLVIKLLSDADFPIK